MERFLFYFLLTFSLAGGESLPSLAEKVIERYWKEAFYPKTLRVISYYEGQNNNVIGVLQNHLMGGELPALVGRERPIVASPDPRTLSTGRYKGRIEVFRYITILLVEDGEKVLNQALWDLQKIISRRWERILIITRSEQQARNFAEHPVVQDYVHKVIISLERYDLVWVDPTFHNNGRMMLSSSALKPQTLARHYLQGRTLRVAAYEMMPWAYASGKNEKGETLVDGDQMRVIREAGKMYNYSIDINYDESYGTFWEHNGSWTDAISHVIELETTDWVADMLPAVIYDWVWDYGFDITSPMNPTSMVFIGNYARTSYKWYAFLLPYSPDLWGWVVATFWILGFVQAGVMYFLIHNRKWKYVVWDSATFLPYAMAMEQGLVDIPKGARYTSLIWLLACTVLSAGYKATLRENLSFPKPDRLPTDFMELSETPESFKIWLYARGSVESLYMAESTKPELWKVNERAITDLEAESCLRNVLRAYKGVCIAWDKNIRAEAASRFSVILGKESFVISKEKIKTGILTPCFQRDSPIADAYQRIVEGFTEGGLMLLYESHEIRKLQKKGLEVAEGKLSAETYAHLEEAVRGRDYSKQIGLKMSNLWAVFYFFPVMTVFTFLLFLLEYCVGKKEMKLRMERKEKEEAEKLANSGAVEIETTPLMIRSALAQSAIDDLPDYREEFELGGKVSIGTMTDDDDDDEEFLGEDEEAGGVKRYLRKEVVVDVYPPGKVVAHYSKA